MLFHMYQVFSSLQGHLHFLCIFSSLLWNTFLLSTLYRPVILLLVQLTEFSHLESREIEKMNNCLNVKTRQYPDWLLNKRKKIKSN